MISDFFNGKEATVTALISLPSYCLFEPVIGNNGFWLVMMLFMGARGLLLSLMAKKSVLSNV